MSFPDDHDPFIALNKAAPPKASDAARARALLAGRAAFDAAAAQQASKKTGPSPKGADWRRRLMSISTSFKRISIMDMRIPVGTAAIALLLLPLGYQLYSTTAMTQMSAQPVQQPAFTEPAAEAAAPATEAQPAPVSEPAPAPEPAVAQDMGAGGIPPMLSTHDQVSRQQQMTMGESEMAPMPSAAPMAVSAPAPKLSVVPTGGYADADAMFAPAEASGDSFERFDEQRLRVVQEEPVSTFSLDVDTASYSYVRRMLEDGMVPAPEAVRIEELINYFPYDYPAAENAEEPFRPTVKVFPTPWNPATQLLSIAIKGYEPPVAEARKSNLVFLIDTSGSMDAPDKLPLLKRAFGLLLEQLSADDTVSIVAYAGSAGVVLEPTAADNKATIMAALDQLAAGGSTAGADGIALAYRLAEQARVDGTNRVILATDGDFNVGIDNPEALEDFIAEKRRGGVSLSVLGFGRGNLEDATMQALAQNGNGNASYISSFAEAKKVLVEEIGGTLHTIAQDVKVQVEFNPAVVSEYRLIGYETRALNREDFNNDAVDAGDIGAGHTVTALYEITPVGSDARTVDPLRYGDAPVSGEANGEIAFLKMRYKLPGDAVSQLIEMPVTADFVETDIADAGVDSQFAAAVAAFGQKLKGSVYGGAMSWEEIEALAQAGRGADEGGYRAEFVRLISTAALLKPDTSTR